MMQDEVLGLFRQTDAIISGTHVVYSSGRHGDTYVNKDQIYPYTAVVSRLCSLIAFHFRMSDVEAVVGPAVGGVILSQWTAYHLTKMMQENVTAVYADKTEANGGFVIKRDYGRLIRGRRVLVVEDVLTTGTSVRGVIQTVRQYEGIVIGLGALCNRGSVTAMDVGLTDPLFSLLDLNLRSWSEDDCPLCRARVPINQQLGHGVEFLAKRQS